MLTARVLGFGLCAPGLRDFPGFVTWLCDASQPLPAGRSAQPSAARLAPTERRRAPHAVRLAVDVASQATTNGHDAAGAVFCSAFGDMANTDVILTTLARAPLEISPIRFTHSVHNAAAGHWSIVAASHAPTTALACGREGVGAALLAALLEVDRGHEPQLLVCSDTADAGALGDAARCDSDFAVALLLGAEHGNPGAPLLRGAVRVGPGRATPPRDARLRPWWGGNPAARLLPLVEDCLQPGRQGFTLPLGSGTLLAIDCETPN